MNILEFIEKSYPIRNRVKDKLSDPYERIKEMDSLPYDRIGPDENGTITKLVDIDDYTSIPVIDLISYTKEEVSKSNDAAFKEVYEAYMSTIDISDVNVIDIMKCAREYKEISIKRKEQLDVLSNGKE